MKPGLASFRPSGTMTSVLLLVHQCTSPRSHLQGLSVDPLCRPVQPWNPGVRVPQYCVDGPLLLRGITAAQRRDRRLHQPLAALRSLPCAAAARCSVGICIDVGITGTVPRVICLACANCGFSLQEGWIYACAGLSVTCCTRMFISPHEA